MTAVNITAVQVSPARTSDLSDTATLICVSVIFTTCLTTTSAGIVTNIINIVCFCETGFKDPINITLLGLAVSDLGCLTTLLWLNIFLFPSVSSAGLPFETTSVTYIVAGIPHLIFSRISCWITAVITLERCLCVILPLKVDNIVTPKRMAAVIISLFIITTACDSPLYVVNRLGIRLFPDRNITLLTLITSGDRNDIKKFSFAINNFTMPVLAFVLITFCTTILVVNLRDSAKWRNSTTAGNSSFSNRNLKVCKMIVMISALFISCFVPITVIMFTVSFHPDIVDTGKNLNKVLVASGVGFLLESINSSSNIYIYYNMSSKYREICRSIFCKH